MSTAQYSPIARDGLPFWVAGFVGPTIEARTCREDGRDVSVTDAEYGALATVRVHDARAMRATDLTAATTSAYRTIRRLLDDRPALRVARMWNFVPGILEPVDGLPHRYMAFNAGRFAAIEEWTATDGDVAGWMPTASGVGDDGPDLVVHALAGPYTPVPVENPRQIPSYRYSRRYGPHPPCFSRAVRVPAHGTTGALLLLGGTASVVGEETRHPGDLTAQLDETLANLSALITAGLPRAPGPVALQETDPLSPIRSAVVYHVRERDRDTIERRLRARLTTVDSIEFARRSLCRDDLLVEIEGTATA